MTIRCATTTALLILSLAAAGAPAASARPAGPDTASPAYGQSSTAVRPNPDEQTATGTPANRAIAAVYSRQDKSTIPTSEATQPTRVAPSVAAPQHAYASGIPTGVAGTVVHVASPGGRFDWGDAGIGAAGGIVLLMLGLGGMRGASRYRTRHSAALSG